MNATPLMQTAALALLVAASAVAGSVPAASSPASAAPTSAPATQASATQPAQTKFDNGDPIGPLLTAMAQRFGVIVVQEKPVDAYVLRDAQLPEKLQDALSLVKQNLEPQGFTILQSFSQSRLILRVVTTEQARQIALTESPVSFGTEPEKVDVSIPDRPVTHVFPINHVDLIETLKGSATQDKSVSAEVAGGRGIGAALVLTGPALKVQRAVELLARLDQANTPQVVARTLQLQHIDAQASADALNQGFAQGTAPMKAVVDKRTNSIVVTGPEDQVMQVMVSLIAEDAKHGPILPRPQIPPAPGPAPITPPPALPVPGEGPKPSAGLLDENPSGGNNAYLLRKSLALSLSPEFSSFVKEVTFLRNSEQLGGLSAVLI